MEHSDGTTDVVHPEVRAHINSLVSALGGTSADDDGQYRLGDDATEVLRDLKKWIRFYDEKTNRMDVARCIAEANLVEGDLLPILAGWPESATDNKFRARIALACFEILVPLTWPIDKDPERMTNNHHRHMPVLELAQLGYKRAIINYDAAQILHTAVRAALPSMATSIGDRTPRDHGIIKLALFFLRNIAMIVPPPNVKFDGDETMISRSTTIDTFSFQDIFAVILMIASNMGEDFRTEDVTVMEIIFHLVKQVDSKKLFMDERQLSKTKAKELSDMMNKEKAMRTAYNRKQPTRHNRFGTMVWMQRGDGRVSTITGQDALGDSAIRQQKLDESKTFKPARRARKDEVEPKDLGAPVKLNSRASGQLRTFVEDFLDAGFNPLFEHVRKSIDREASHVLTYHRRQFMYLVAWFLEAERNRRKSKRDAKKPNAPDEVSSFNLVAGVLHQEMFITLTKTMHDSWEHKEWPTLTAAFRCFTQILLTVQEMSESGNEDNEEIAENILSRLFYEDSTHDLIANVVRQYKDQGFEYLDSATELTHHFLRILEAYSKQNVDMQVRSRKRTRKKKKAAQDAAGSDNVDEQGDESANDEANAERESKERKFDFHRFTSRFTPQGVVDTFVAFTKYYRDLDDSQLKRAHRYFYRVAFKQEMSVMLFRVDIVHLFHSMIKGPEPLDKHSGMYKEWEELSKQILRKCIRKIEQRPELVIEMLFSKINSTAHYLEFGYEKQTISTSHAKPAAELEFKHTEDREQQIAIAIGALLDKNQLDHIAWVKKTLETVEAERRAWAAANQVIPSVEGTETPTEDAAATDPANLPDVYTVRPDDDSRKTAMFKNSHLRLLMKLVGMERLAPMIDETPQSLWVLPPHVTADHLRESLDFINKAEFSPPVFDDGRSAEDQLRRKKAPRIRAEYDDDDDDLDDGFLFDPLGPTVHKNIDEPAKKPKKRRRRKVASDEEAPNDSELEEKARKRRDREREKMRKIKSEAYVHASDDETDEERDREFFLREEAQRSRVARVVERVALAQPDKRPAATLLEDSDDNDDDVLAVTRGTPQSTRPSADVDMEDRSDGEQNGADDPTPPTSSQASSQSKGTRKRRRLSPEESAVTEESKADKGADADTEGDEDEDVPAAAARSRKRTRGGFVMDSSDEE
ncbi:DNA repair protein [Colletotrichum karsti]|uniref:Topoisomerase 1-associated factor 1 n=1 Tax=Colletotrichum karsti TaxID=1095194 RepID=A0A9P6IE78_9PEZI|nr:DNA repair protein [Colletotrichum karsti]KAF9881224.1 DNA repair protein [Colletotrichum karsti]